MWQRIQTLYLALATGFIVALYWCNLSSVVMDDGTLQYIAYTDKTVFTIWISLLTIFHVLALGGYKWRMKQFRVVIFTAIVCAAFQIWLVLYYFQTKGVEVISWTALFPLVAVILDVLAARNILLDEAIVFSANRLRSPRKKR